MKFSKAETQAPVHAVPEIRFEDQNLTSSAGLVLFQVLFQGLDLRNRLRRCFSHLPQAKSYSHAHITLLLVVHLLLGYRRLRDIRYYQDDPMLHRVLGLRRLPSVSCVSRRLKEVDVEASDRVRGLTREMVLDRLVQECMNRVTLDFDGSVCSTRRRAEGTAIGFNPKRKGDRSYYPLFCTVAQTGQVLDVLHRPGNVHDSNGASDFIEACMMAVARRLGRVTLESRLDAAFFAENTVLLMESLDAEFTVSVPFERLAGLKATLQSRQRWRRIDETWSYFEQRWKPETWLGTYRVIFFRQKVSRRSKEPLQLDLFDPQEWEYVYKAVMTNKRAQASRVLQFHNGRGAQEGILGEIKSLCQIDYVPTVTLAGNQLYLQAGILAHNLGREFQMRTEERRRGTVARRATLWTFQKLSTLRHLLLRRAGRLTNQSGRLVLIMGTTETIRERFDRCLEALDRAA